MNIKELVQERFNVFLHDKDEKNLIIQIVMAFAVKGLALIVSFFSMPLYIRFFDNDDVLGLWYTILSMLSWVNICDLGLGNGLRNRLTQALAVGDTQKAKKYVSSTYVALATVICPVIVTILIVVQLADLNAFFNISESLISRDILRTSISILLCGVAVSFVLRTVSSIIYAIQKSSVNNIISLIISILPLVFVALFRSNSMEDNLVILTIVHVLATNVPLLVATLILFCGKKLRAVAPSLRSCSVETAKSMLSLGLKFFLAQIFFMALISTNEIIITNFFSSADVVQYSIYYRLFTVVGSLFMLALTPLWSKITKDLALKRYQKIIETNRLLYRLAGLATLVEFLMVPILQFAINIWLKDEAITVNYIIGLIFAFYGSAYILNIVLTTVANGMGDLRTQIMFYGIFSILKIPTIYLFAQQGLNWSVVMLYNAIALTIFCLFQFIWLEKKLKKVSRESLTPEEKL